MEVVKSVILLGVVLSVTHGEGEEACETIPSEIHVIKGNYQLSFSFILFDKVF